VSALSGTEKSHYASGSYTQEVADFSKLAMRRYLDIDLPVMRRPLVGESDLLG
jgi:hypothetical protein